MKASRIEDNRKRYASVLSDEQSCKRSCFRDANAATVVEASHRSHHKVPGAGLEQDLLPSSSSCSIDAFLSVPLEIIFRESPATSVLSMATQQQQQSQQQQACRSKPLLTRVEARTFIRTSQLAFEIDVLVHLSSEALSEKIWCRSTSHKLERTNNPFLRPLLPLLAIHGEVVPNSALRTFQEQLDGIMIELEKCVSALRQYSEQNWTVAESLLDALGYQLDDDDDENDIDNIAAMSPLAAEKRILADIEEEVCRRIENLLGIVPNQEANATTIDGGIKQPNDSDLDFTSSMAEFCRRLFGCDNGKEAISLLGDVCVTESIGIEQDNRALSKTLSLKEKSPPKRDGGGSHEDGGITATTTIPASSSSPADDDEPTEQESFEPSQERNPFTVNITSHEKKSATDQEASTQNAAFALAVLCSSRTSGPQRAL